MHAYAVIPNRKKQIPPASNLKKKKKTIKIGTYLY